MLKLWVIVCIFEILKLWNLGFQILDMARVLFVFFMIAVPGSVLILNIGKSMIKRDYSGTKFKLLIGVAMGWMLLSAYVLNQYIFEVLKFVKSFV